jgi:hypothetical protein
MKSFSRQLNARKETLVKYYYYYYYYYYALKTTCVKKFVQML